MGCAPLLIEGNCTLSTAYTWSERPTSIARQVRPESSATQERTASKSMPSAHCFDTQGGQHVGTLQALKIPGRLVQRFPDSQLIHFNN